MLVYIQVNKHKKEPKMNKEPKPAAPLARLEAPLHIDSRIAVMLSAASEVIKSDKATVHVTTAGTASHGSIRQRDTFCDAVTPSGLKYTVHDYKLNAAEGDSGLGLITITALNPSEHIDKMEHATGLEYVICPEGGQYGVFVRNKGLVDGKPDETLRQITDDAELDMLAGKIEGLQAVADIYAPAQ